jgi:hypothetical protein
MELTVVPVVKPDAANFIFGQSHFIKTVEDLHEALVGAVPGIRFGLAFCEASGKRLVRWSGNDEAALALARDNALAIGDGHTFLIFLGDGFFPVNAGCGARGAGDLPHLLRDRQPDTGNRRTNGAGPRRARRGGWRLAIGRRNRRRHCVATYCESSATSCSGWMKPKSTGRHGQHRRAQCSQLDRQTPRLVHGYRGRERRVLPSEPGEQ